MVLYYFRPSQQGDITSSDSSPAKIFAVYFVMKNVHLMPQNVKQKNISLVTQKQTITYTIHLTSLRH